MKSRTRQQVDALIDEIFDNPEEIKAGIDRLEKESRLVNALLDARHAAGLTQRELAKASGLSAAKICRMESDDDRALRVGDVQTYLKGLGATLEIRLRRPRCSKCRKVHPLTDATT